MRSSDPNTKFFDSIKEKFEELRSGWKLIEICEPVLDSYAIRIIFKIYSPANIKNNDGVSYTCTIQIQDPLFIEGNISALVEIYLLLIKCVSQFMCNPKKIPITSKNAKRIFKKREEIYHLLMNAVYNAVDNVVYKYKAA